MWNQKSMRAIDLSISIAARLLEFCGNQSTPNRPSRIQHVKWRAPLSGVWKVNIDVAFNHVTRRGGASFVIRDSSGNVSAGGAAPLTGLISAE